MLKNISQLEYKIGERVYQLNCASDSPIVEAKEAVSQFMAYLVQIENQAKANAEAIPPESVPEVVEMPKP